MLPPALRHRRYRLLWIGLLISTTGTRMQMAAVLWHVNELSGQPIALSGIGLARILPVVLFSLLAGTAADRINRRRLMFLTQISLATLATVLALATFLDRASLPLIYLVVALEGAAFAFDLPARHALVPSLVSPDTLTNAFSLNSIAFQVGSVAGPALGGFVLAHLGQGWAYAFNAATYLAVIAALIRMGPVAHEVEARRAGDPIGTIKDVAAAAWEGLRFVMRQPIIASSMLLDFFATLFASATVLLPIFARDLLQVGPVGYGWLVAAPSVGAAAAALSLAFTRDLRRQGPVLLVSVAIYGLATIVFGLSRSFWLAFVALAVTGAADSVSAIIRNTIRQLLTPDRLRGRMTSVNQVFFMGGPQLGEVEAGLVAQWFGPVVAVVTGGIGCLLATAWIAARYPQLRRYNGDEPLRGLAPAGGTPTGV